MIAILSLILVIGCSLLVTKVASTALVHTGMERERAKFQARSAFTGAGFTTSESEQVVKHPTRRKIILSLLLLGNAGFVTAISSLIIGFTNANAKGTQVHHIYLLLLSILSLFLITRSKKLERMLDRIILYLLKRYTDIRPKSFERLMTIMDDYEVMEVSVEENTWLCDGTLASLKLTEEGILVLGVVRKNGSYNGVPRGNYQIKEDDKLIMYGKAEQIEKISKRLDKLQAKMEHIQSKEALKKELYINELEEVSEKIYD